MAALAGFAGAAVWLVERLPESASPGPAPLWTAMLATVWLRQACRRAL